MRKIRETLRLHYDAGLGVRAISRSLKASPSTVREYLVRAKLQGLSWPLPESLDDAALLQRLYPTPRTNSKRLPPPQWSKVHRELRRKGVTLALLWEEYKAVHPEGMQYSWFCARYREWAAKVDVVMRQEHRAGERMFVDYAGHTVAVVNRDTGELREAQIFVAVLGASNYTYAEATWTQTLPDWIASHVRTFQFMGGSTELLIPDNLRSAVSRANRYEPDTNPTYHDLACHYGVAVLPARVKKPRDKGLVESAVGAVQTRILLALRHETFFSLDAMNAAIARELDRLNEAPMASGETRRAVFEATERTALQALPANPWEWGEWVERKVALNGHVRVEHNHYSVPDGHIGRTVAARVGERMVEVFLDRGGERIAVHRRNSGRNQYATHPNHMPDRLKAVRDIRKPDYGDILLSRARRIGRNALAWSERCFASRDFPEQAFTTVQGMVRLADDHGRERIDALCAEALDLNRLASGFLRQRLKNACAPRRPRPEPEETIPSHTNIRGGNYYRNDKGGATP